MKVRSLGVMLALALVTVACGGDTDTDATPTTDDTQDLEANEPVRGGTLVAAIDSDPGQLNPAITTSGAVHTASELMFTGLVELSPSLEPVPGLAESWEIEEDGAVYRFTLQDGVTWHDGEPFTSADVKYSFEEVLHRPRPVHRASPLRPGGGDVPGEDRRDRRPRRHLPTTTHLYTQSLLSAVPVPDPTQRGRRARFVLQGDAPDAAEPPTGCHFRTRCWKAQHRCAEADPELLDRFGHGHPSACFFADAEASG